MAGWRSQVALTAASDALRVKGRGRQVSYGSFSLPQMKLGRASSDVLRRCLAAVLVSLLLFGGTPPGANMARAEEATPANNVVSGDPASSLNAAATWLLGQQDASGGFRGYSGGADASATAAAVLALYAAGSSDEAIDGSIDKAMTFLDQSGAEYAAAGAG